jgi:hypothetical protein
MRVTFLLPLVASFAFAGVAHAALSNTDVVCNSAECSGSSGTDSGTSNDTGTVVTPPVSVPEPGTLGLLALGMMGLAAARRRK